jgi:hypothetical protein
MGFLHMALVLSADDQVAYSFSVLEAVTDEMRKEMGVDPGAEPFAPGANSAVFENGNGNIVVFSDYPRFHEVAKKAEALRSDTLPEIYAIKKFKVGDEEPMFGESAMYAVEMEYLKVLDSGETKVWHEWQDDVFSGSVDPSSVPPGEKNFVDAMVSLKERSERDKVVQRDLWAGNITWDDKGNLKFIDLEVIDLDGADLAPQAQVAPEH